MPSTPISATQKIAPSPRPRLRHVIFWKRRQRVIFLEHHRTRVVVAPYAFQRAQRCSIGSSIELPPEAARHRSACDLVDERIAFGCPPAASEIQALIDPAVLGPRDSAYRAIKPGSREDPGTWPRRCGARATRSQSCHARLPREEVFLRRRQRRMTARFRARPDQRIDLATSAWVEVELWSRAPADCCSSPALPVRTRPAFASFDAVSW